MDFLKDEKLDLSQYEAEPQYASAITKMLLDKWNELGKPQDPFSDSGEKMLKAIVAVWEEHEPLEAKAWYEERKNYKKEEMEISDQVAQGTGRSLASYPFMVYQLMKIFFTDFKPAERKTVIKFVRKYPMFRFCKRI